MYYNDTMNLGSKKSVVRARAGGASTTDFFLVADFALRNANLGGGESEGEAGIHFPHTPFSARLARALGFWRAKRAISSAQKRFGLCHIIAPINDFLR